MCSICSGALVRADKGDPDWLGRQIGRHADRANRALERARVAEEEAAGLRARCEHYDGIAAAHAADLVRIAKTAREVDRLRDEAAELTKRADDAIPFGPDAPDESQIAAWRDRARVLLEVLARFEKAIG